MAHGEPCLGRLPNPPPYVVSCQGGHDHNDYRTRQVLKQKRKAPSHPERLRDAAENRVARADGADGANNEMSPM